jgi:acetyltransferase-like isoleucine patch superfamily enzyme
VTEPRLWSPTPPSSGPSITIGDHTYGHEQISVRHWGEPAALRIGKFCSIADRITVFLGGNHRTDWISTYPFPAFPEAWPDAARITGHPATDGDVVIGNDVWVGSNVTIMSGLTIGDGAVLAADSTVVKDVPPYGIVGGNPAKVLRLRFAPHQIRGLLAVRWWDWPDERIHAEVGQIASTGVDAFLARHAPADVVTPRLCDRLARFKRW